MGYWSETQQQYIDSILEYVLTIICIFLSFYGLIKASETIPTGTAYAVFVGLGSVGVVFSGIVFFGESVSFLKIGFIILLIVGVIGLKLVSEEKETEK